MCCERVSAIPTGMISQRPSVQSPSTLIVLPSSQMIGGQGQTPAERQKVPSSGKSALLSGPSDLYTGQSIGMSRVAAVAPRQLISVWVRSIAPCLGSSEVAVEAAKALKRSQKDAPSVRFNCCELLKTCYFWRCRRDEKMMIITRFIIYETS